MVPECCMWEALSQCYTTELLNVNSGFHFMLLHISTQVSGLC